MPSALSPVLTYSLWVNAIVALIAGAALVWVWRRHRAPLYTRDLGAAQLLHALVPVGYLIGYGADAQGELAGLTMALLGQMGSAALILWGSSRLAGPLTPRLQLALLIGLPSLLVLAGLSVLAFRAPSVAMGVCTFLTVLAGVVLARCLRRGVAADRLVGPLLVLLGINQLGFPLWGESALVIQTNADTLLRLVWVLALVYAVLDRVMSEVGQLRERFEQLVERSHQGILVLVEQHVQYANPALLRLYGFNHLGELNVAGLLQGLPRKEIEQVLEHYFKIEGGSADDVRWEGMRHRKDGSPMWLQFSGWRTQWEGVPAIQILVTDRTSRRDATQALLKLATRDELTGLPNRSALLQRLRQRCMALPDRPEFGLVLLGIDRFKLFNEAHGHSLGDEVLKALAAALVRELGEGCELMRLGADEFALLAQPYLEGDTAISMARRVQQMLQRPLKLPEHNFFIDVSMGIALYPHDAQDAEALLRAANAAMHAAKRTPGTSVVLAEARFERGSSDLLKQEQAMRVGIEQREFCLHYQPKVDAQTGQLTSFEALARWHRPGVGWVSPVEFIAVAERTGLIAELGLLLLTLACEQVASWRQQLHAVVPVAVNVSPLQMLDGGFPVLVAELLRQHGLPAHSITLEITESAAVANIDLVQMQMQQLREMGIVVALDDFGTGFSSLHMLRNLPLQSVKIDRDLIEPLPAPDAAAVVRAICQLALALRLEVVAEGVETPVQAEIARMSGCHELQGNLFAKPLIAEEAALWMEGASVAVWV